MCRASSRGGWGVKNGVEGADDGGRMSGSTAVTANIGAQGPYRGSGSGRCGHKQAARSPVSLDGYEQKRESRQGQGWEVQSVETAVRQRVGQHGQGGSAGRHRGQRQADGAEVCGAGRRRDEWARPGSAGPAGWVLESLAGAWPGGRTPGPAESPALTLRKRRME